MILVLIIFIVVIGGIATLIWHHFAKKERESMKDSEVVIARSRGLSTGIRKKSSRSQSALKIMLAFGIIVYGMGTVFSLQYPPGFQKFVDTVMAWLSLGILSSLTGLECLIDTSFYTKVLLETLLPLGVTAILAAATTLHRMSRDRIQARWGIQEQSREHEDFRNLCFTIFLWMTCKLNRVRTSDTILLPPPLQTCADIVLSAVAKTIFDIFGESFHILFRYPARLTR